MAGSRPTKRRKSPRRSRAITAGRRERGFFERHGPLLLLALVLGALGWFFRADIRALFNPSPAPLATAPAAPLPVTPFPERLVQASPATAAANAPGEQAVRFAPPPPIPADSGYPRLAANLLEAQIALARRLISSGSIDGVAGAQTAAALSAFQTDRGLPATGALDEATRAHLVLDTPPLARLVLDAADFADLQPLPATWVGKSERATLAHETLLERLAERTQAHPNLLRRLNPAADWAALAPGASILAPSIRREPPATPVAHLHIRLGERVLQARDARGALVAHFPVSIAKRVEKRPVGELHVVVVVPDPNYTFDPAVFPESAEARQLDRKLILPPGPNNPVGVAWIGLDRPGYGIHGTPTPEQVGRTESHGCFRLANWDARALLALVRPRLPVYVEP